MPARGPNALNINSYANGEDQPIELEQPTSSRRRIDPQSVEEQFDDYIKETQQYDKILSEVAKNIEEIGGNDEFITDFYPKFIWESTYEEDEEKKIIASTDPEMAKIVLNLQCNNKILKEDMRSWVLQFAKTAKLTQVLIGQNKVLRQSIAKKNSEIVKIIQNIGLAQNEEITELVQNLSVLKEENGVLRQHLLQLKQEVQQKTNEQKNIEQALQKTRQQFSILDKTKAEAEDQEEHLSKSYELIQQCTAEADKRKRKLEKQKSLLLAKRKDYENQKQAIQKELQICERQKNELQEGLRKKYNQQQTKKYTMMNQIHDLGQEISKQKDQCRSYEQEIIKNTNKKDEYQKVTKEYLKKITDNQQKIEELKKELSIAEEAEVTVHAQIQLEKYDISILKQELQELQGQEKQMSEKWKQSLRQLQAAQGRAVDEEKDRIAQNQREMAMRILSQKSQLAKKQQQLEIWEQKVYDKKEELHELKNRMKQIKQNQLKLAQLKTKLHAQNIDYS